MCSINFCKSQSNFVNNFLDSFSVNFFSISPEEISREMEGIRNALVTLAFCYIEGEEGFSELDENTHFETFLEEEENIE